MLHTVILSPFALESSEVLYENENFSPVPMNQNFNGKPRKYAFLTSYPSDSYTYGTWNPLYWKNRYCNYRLKKKKSQVLPVLCLAPGRVTLIAC